MQGLKFPNLVACISSLPLNSADNDTLWILDVDVRFLAHSVAFVLCNLCLFLFMHVAGF